MAASHGRNLVMIRLQTLDKKLFRGDAKCSLVLKFSDPRLPHILGAENSLLDNIRDIVINPAAQKVSFPTLHTLLFLPSYELVLLQSH